MKIEVRKQDLAKENFDKGNQYTMIPIDIIIDKKKFSTICMLYLSIPTIESLEKKLTNEMFTINLIDGQFDIVIRRNNDNLLQVMIDRSEFKDCTEILSPDELKSIIIDFWKTIDQI
jgi:hypothetical protein